MCTSYIYLQRTSQPESSISEPRLHNLPKCQGNQHPSQACVTWMTNDSIWTRDNKLVVLINTSLEPGIQQSSRGRRKVITLDRQPDRLRQLTRTWQLLFVRSGAPFKVCISQDFDFSLIRCKSIVGKEVKLSISGDIAEHSVPLPVRVRIQEVFERSKRGATWERRAKFQRVKGASSSLVSDQVGNGSIVN